MTHETARLPARPAAADITRSPAAASSRRKRTVRTSRAAAPSRTSARARDRSFTNAVAGAFAALARVLAGAAALWAATVGFDGFESPSPAIVLGSPAAASAPAMAIPAVWTVDVTGDGIADLANPTSSTIRAVDLWGSGAFGAPRSTGKRRRIHQGADYVAYPGQIVRSPIAGEVTKIGFAYRNDRTLRFVEITNRETRQRARVLYVKPSVRKGQTIAVSDPIGGAQNLRSRYPGITNHVHVELRDARGRNQDPALVLPNTPQFVTAHATEPSPT